MRVLVLTQNLIPYPTGFGSAVHVWSLVKTLLDRHHDVHLCCYAFSPDREKAEWVDGDYRATIDELTNLGLRVHLIPRQRTPLSTLRDRRVNLIRKVLAPNVSDFYAGPSYESSVTNLIDDLAPDAVCAWTVDSVAATSARCRGKIPRLGFLTDLDHLANQFRRRYRATHSLKGRMYEWLDALAERKLPGLSARLLGECEVVVDHAAHHCEWLRRKGVSRAQYLPVPVLDEAGPDWQAARMDALSRNRVPKIALVGNLTGVATLAGLHLFANEVLPEIERRLEEGQAGMEIHIIGGGRLPADLAGMLERPYVKLRGYADDIQAEFRSSDIFLVPTPIDLGFRTRIAEGFSFGCCVVAHAANALGMPELRNEDNVLLSNTGPGLAEAVIRCLNSSELRQELGISARATFERELDGAVICAQMVDALEESISKNPVAGELLAVG